MAIQQANAFAWCEEQVGKRMEILIDKAIDEAENAWVGRSFADAPDVDSSVFITGDKELTLRPGCMVECEIVSYKDYDLVGAAIGVPH